VPAQRLAAPDLSFIVSVPLIFMGRRVSIGPLDNMRTALHYCQSSMLFASQSVYQALKFLATPHDTSQRRRQPAPRDTAEHPQTQAFDTSVPITS